MKIQTTLNIDDQVFFLSDKKVVNSIVQQIKIEVESPEDVKILYLCNDEKGKQVHLKVYQEFAFKTKQELIKSL